MISYQLGALAATRRARAAVAVGVTAALAPLTLAGTLLRRFAWTHTVAFWTVAGAIGVLVMVRAVAQYAATKRRFHALRVVLDDEGIATRTNSDAYSIPRARVARIVEIDGALGGLRIESEPEIGDGLVIVASVPRGGEAFAEVRARLERWHVIERKRKHGPARRLLAGALVVAAIFFLPFVLDDIAARSNFAVALFIAVAWIGTRWILRGR